MQPLPYRGSTSDFYRHTQDVVLKAPMEVVESNPNRESLEAENAKAIDIERQILERLGRHPRIVPYLGSDAEGIYLSEARLGNLQTYIDSYSTKLRPSQRAEMCKQVAEAIVYAHGKGVIHSDLRPENFLVDGVDDSSLRIWLCDFGGSICEELGLNGGHLPDTPFFDPRMKWESTPATDIFSLGSIFYTIQTGYWPFRDSPPQWDSVEEKVGYENQVDSWFNMGRFPSVSHIIGGDVILGCWNHQYNTAKEVLEAVQVKMAPAS